MTAGTAACSVNPRLVGDPVDVVSGACTHVQGDFQLPGPCPLYWNRYYDSGKAAQEFTLGWGHSHEYERELRFDLDGMTYVGPLGRAIHFPAPTRDGARIAAQGVMLHRVGLTRYSITSRSESTLEFEFRNLNAPAPLAALVRAGHRISFEYDAAGRLSMIVDSAGHAIRVDSDAHGRIVRLTRLASRIAPERILVAYLYDVWGRLIAGVNAYNHGFSYEYDGVNRMLRQTDRNGYSFLYAYDETGRCIESRGQDGLHAVQLAYFPVERRTVVRRADGGQWTYLSNDAGAVTGVLDPYGAVKTYQYDKGRITAELDPAGSVTQWLYDPAGKLLGRTSPTGQFAPHGREMPKPNVPEHRVAGTPLEWEFGRWLAAVHLSWPAPAAAVVARLPDWLRPHARTSVPQPVLGIASDRDAFPLVAAPSAVATRRVRDDFGRLVREETVSGGTRRWSYDRNGNVAHFVDATGGVHRFEYNSWNLLVQATDPLGAVARFAYTKHEKMAVTVDAGGTTSEYHYDLKDRLVEIRRHGVVKERYVYDAADRMVAKSDATGSEILRLTPGAVGLPAERQLASGENHSFEYDPRGRLLRAATNVDTVEFAYDEFGNRTLDSRNGAGVEQVFNSYGRTARSTAFGRFAVVYRRTHDNVLVIADPGGQSHTFTHLGNGLVQRQLSSGTVEISQFSADGLCHLRASWMTRVNGKRRRASYRYNGEGDLTSADDSHLGTFTFEYDAARRLSVAAEPDGTQQLFRYDRAGNLTNVPGLGTVEYGEGNRLARCGDRSFEYDARNHLAAIHDSTGRTTRFAYDSRGFLSSVESNGLEWQADYDALGRRSRVRVNGATQQFYWDTDRLSAEISHEGRVRVYVYTDALALTPFMFMDFDGLDADPVDGRRYFIFANQVGAPIRVENESGELVWECQLSPYGEARVSASSTIELALRFPGHYLDGATGLHYNRFRYYDPRLGRYLQSDPIGTGGSLNVYAYTPSPLTHVDVRGLSCENHLAGHNPDCDDCADNEETQVKGAPRAPDPDTVEQCGPVTPAGVDRRSERPYTHPPEMYVVAPGQPIDVDLMNPQAKYLWVVDPDGNVIIAPDNQPGFGDGRRPPGTVKHRDLVANPDGSPGAARSGGEMNYNKDTGKWEMNNDSSYTFARGDGGRTNGDNLNAAHDLLTQSGTDTSNVDAKNSHGSDAPDQ